VAAASATDAARTDVIARYQAATVFVTVTSQVALRPSRQGIEVKQSGRLPSNLVNPFCSLTEGIPVLVIACQTRSSMKWCRWVLPGIDCLSADALMCLASSVLSWRLTATRTALSLHCELRLLPAMLLGDIARGSHPVVTDKFALRLQWHKKIIKNNYNNKNKINDHLIHLVPFDILLLSLSLL